MAAKVLALGMTMAEQTEACRTPSGRRIAQRDLSLTGLEPDELARGFCDLRDCMEQDIETLRSWRATSIQKRKEIHSGEHQKGDADHDAVAAAVAQHARNPVE